MGFLPTNKDRRAFVTWVRYTSRSASLAKGLNAENWFIVHGASLRLLKYIPRAIVTMTRLIRLHPASVFVMSPPYFAGLTVYVYCLLFRARFVIDAHTGAFDDPKWTWMMPLQAFLFRRAEYCIVTNHDLAERVKHYGGKPIVLSDIPFELPPADFPLDRSKFNVCLVSTYASDEPIPEVFDAVRPLSDVHVYVTGDSRKAGDALRAAKPDNVTLTGFLSETDYAGLLQSVDCLLVLTTRDFTMQRGGSEAITAAKPLITSDWPILREIFSSGTIHVDNSAGAIAEAIRAIQQNPAAYREGILTLRSHREARWKEAKAELERALS